MNDMIETWRTVPRRPPGAAACRAILVSIYPPGAGMGSRFLIALASQVIGRGPDCDIRVADASVSRHHARVESEDGAYTVRDLQSTNGTFVNDQPASRSQLKDGDYLRVGNCIFRFLAGDNAEAAYHEEIVRRTIVDALTDVHNKRYLMESLDRELARALRSQQPLALLLFDIDQFKWINDQLGHLAGDFTLRELAARIKTELRREGELARYGGDEFAILLPETPRLKALHRAERLRRVVEQPPFCYDDKPYPVTISVGLAVTTGAPPLTSQEFLQRADDNLLRAKRNGRNRVEG
jgi:diguanylate cyclase (GGDEF)-like protein